MSLSTVVFRRVAKPAHLFARQQLSVFVDSVLGIVTTDERVAKALMRDLGEYRRTNRALPWIGLWRTLRHLPSSPTDVLVDFGCGAGRVVCGSARVGFARVIGIDLDPAFTALAERNVSSLRGARAVCEIVVGSAAEYRVPDDVTSVFLYNPFGGDVLRAALKRLVESVDRSPRRVRVAYVNPREREILDAMDRFEPVGQLHLSWRPNADWRRTQLVLLYDLIPRGVEATPE